MVLGSFAVQFGDHLRSGIICGLGIICGAVQFSIIPSGVFAAALTLSSVINKYLIVCVSVILNTLNSKDRI